MTSTGATAATVGLAKFDTALTSVGTVVFGVKSSAKGAGASGTGSTIAAAATEIDIPVEGTAETICSVGVICATEILSLGAGAGQASSLDSVVWTAVAGEVVIVCCIGVVIFFPEKPL